MRRKATVFLIGYMASGKTTLGRGLAAVTGRRFVDLDEYIEQKARRTISQIFAEDGEQHFRDLEAEALAELASDNSNAGLIVACGGGTPCFGNNMDLMNERGLTVWLTATPDVIIRRLIAERSSRPLVAKLSDGGELEAFVLKGLESRRPHYERAHRCFDSSRLECEQEVAESVSRFIEEFL